MIYLKNVPTIERMIRVVAGLALVAFGLFGMKGTLLGSRALRQWVRKSQESAQAVATVVCLLPCRTDTLWWHEHVLPHAEVRYIRGRMKFNNAETSAPFPSAIVIFRPRGGSFPQ